MPGIDEHFGRATVENLGKNLINNAIPAPVNAAIHSANDSNNLSSAGTGGESMDNNMSGTGENSSHATGEGIGEVPMDAIIVAPTSLATRQAEDGTKTPSVSMAKTTPIGTNKTLRQVPETSPTPAKSSVKLRKDAHTRRMPNDPAKHEPVAKNAHFRWEDNRNVDETPMKVGKEENDKLYLNLKCTKGEMHEFPWVHRYSMDWNNPEKIKAANIWRKQIINRRLNKNGPGQETHIKGVRPHWSMKEKEKLSYLVRTQIQSTRSYLGPADWKAITATFNDKFAGTKVQVGEMLANPSKKRQSDGTVKNYTKVLTNAHVLPERTWGAIKTQVSRWTDLVDEMNAAYRKVGLDALDPKTPKYSGSDTEVDEKYSDENSEVNSPTKGRHRLPGTPTKQVLDADIHEL